MKFEEEIRQQKFRSQTQKAILNVIFTANWVHEQFREVFKPYGLTQQQYNVLRILRGRYPDCAYPSEIKEVMLDKNPDLTRLCDRMCSNGWIERNVDESNRRKMKIVITPVGLKLLESIDPVMQAMQDKNSFLTDAECDKLSKLLDKMRG